MRFSIRRFLVFTTGVIFLLPGCSRSGSSPDNNKPLPTAKLVIVNSSHYNSTISQYQASITAFNSDGSVAWKTDLDGDLVDDLEPYYWKGVLYYFTSSFDFIANKSYDFIIALDASTGKTLWEHTGDPGKEKIVSPSFYNDTMYCSRTGALGGGNYIYAYQAANGNFLWKAPIPATEHNAVTKAEGSVLYLKTIYSSHVDAFNILSRSIIWSADLGHPVPFDGLRIYQNELFLMTADGNIVVVNKINGSIQRSFQNLEAISLNFDNDQLYVGNKNKGVIALNRTSGSISVTYPLTPPATLESSLYPANGNIVFKMLDYNGFSYYSVNAKTGMLNWKKSTPFGFAPFVAVGDLIYGVNFQSNNAFSTNSYLVKLDSKTGAVKDSVSVGITNTMFYVTVITAQDSLITPRQGR
jgi:outer membrane protein assembly factor BamB